MFSFKWIKEDGLIIKLKDLLAAKYIDASTTDEKFFLAFFNQPIDMIRHKIVWIAKTSRGKTYNKRALIDLITLLSEHGFIKPLDKTKIKVTLNNCFGLPDNRALEIDHDNFSVRNGKSHSELYKELEAIVTSL